MRNGWRRFGYALGGLALCAAVWTAAPQQTYAKNDSGLTVYVDGKKTEWRAVGRDGAAYVTFDTIRKLGGTVEPLKSGAQYSVKQGQQEVRLTVGPGQTTVYYDGVARASELSALSIGGTMYVPLDWVDELLDVRWVGDPLTGSVFVFRKNVGTKPIAVTVREPSAPPAAPPLPRTAVRLPAPSIPAVVSSLPVASAPKTPLTPASSGIAQAGVEIVSKVWPVDGGASNQAPLADAMPALSAIALSGDVLTIALTDAVTPQTFQLASPDRLVIDLPNASIKRAADGTAEGSIAVAKDHPYISNIRYSLFNVEPSTIRIVIDLKRSMPFVVESANEGRSAVVRFDARPFQVMIDAGHGGYDPGAVSVNGRYEKDVNLAVASKVRELLEKESLIKPVMLRTGDTYSSPAERAQMANAAGVNLFVSIHANTASSSMVQGTETYYWNDNSRELAAVMHRRVAEAVQSADRKVKRERFAVVRETAMPAVLLELGFLTNPEDEQRLFSEAVQQRIAEAVVNSIKEYYKIP